MGVLAKEFAASTLVETATLLDHQAGMAARWGDPCAAAECREKAHGLRTLAADMVAPRIGPAAPQPSLASLVIQINPALPPGEVRLVTGTQVVRIVGLGEG